ncbi:hypothetical protein GCM10023346_17020 [Arthrobacter gyeryongensis]|uniref:Uncharacterized protein n=2 Tax=Arthrobacter gyeryongensis TaxID=1650592 RepID=A0ABP9SB92_9MICC
MFVMLDYNYGALKNVAFRNRFEHYDERIDRWWANSASHNILDKMISAPEAATGHDRDRSESMTRAPTELCSGARNSS